MSDPTISRRSVILRELGIVEWTLRSPSNGPVGGHLPVAQPLAEPRDEYIDSLDWEELPKVVASCTECGLCKSRRQTVFGVGRQTAKWLLIGEAPGAEEDARGEPFVGQAGRLVDNMLAAVGLSRDDDVFIANVLKCRPPSNRDPTASEVAACKPFLMRQIELISPDVIVLLGRFAVQAVLDTDVRVGKLRGKVHPVTSGGRSISAIATYHPAYLLRTPADKAKAWADWSFAKEVFNNLSGRLRAE